MGDTVEHWRAKIGLWSGGRPRNCVTLQRHIAQSSNRLGYMQIRFLVLVSLLVIGCVELNPGPKSVRYVIYSNKRLCMCKGLWGKLYSLDGSINYK
jgi:hypothetical protein